MRRLALACALVALAACGDPDVPETDGGSLDASTTDAPADAASDASIAIEVGDLEDDLCAPVAAEVCDRFDTCGCGVLLPGGTLDRDACVARWTERCVAGNAAVIGAGAVVDRAAIRSCLEQLGAAPACHPLELTGPCDHVVTIPVAVGAPCALDRVPCAGGAGMCSDGTCVARAGEGEPCGVCAPALECVESTCVPRATPDLGDAGDACTETEECAQGLACEAAECAAVEACPCGNLELCGGARTCAPRRTSGQACDEDRECTAELFCDDETGTCSARPALGQPCARNVICATGLACDGDGGTCRARPARGATCGYDELGPGACAEGLGCVDFVCSDLPTAGQGCTVDSRCAPGLACEFTAEGSICIVPLAAGARCETDRACGDGLHCGRDGTCEADLPAGSACSVGNECAGVCGPGASGGLVCLDAPAAGDPCLFDEECPIALECRATAPTCIADVCTDL